MGSARNWDDIIGPVYTTSQMAQLLCVSRKAVLARRYRHAIFGMRTQDGRIVFPSFQIVEGHVVSGLPEILRQVANHADEWTLGAWLVAIQLDNGESIIDRLQRCGLDDEVRLCVKNAVSRWSR